MSTPTTAAPARALPATLSLVIPCYNEEEVLPYLRQRLNELLPSIPSRVELIFVNDGSKDSTVAALQQWAREDDRVSVISLSRNFGHQAAVTAGLDYANGEAVVLMDADLQDPPELILKMIEEYQRGFDVVYAQRSRRLGESKFKVFTAWLFYRLLRLGTNQEIPPDTGDYRLISRPCLEALKRMRETHRFIRGMVSWVGFPQTAVQFVRSARVAGATKYPLSKMIRFAWIATISFSAVPLRSVFVMGMLVGLIAVAIGTYALIVFFFHFPVVPGWTSLMFTLCLIGSFILFSLGIVGEYVAKIYEEIKGRPLYLIDFSNSRNLQPPAPGAGTTGTPQGTDRPAQRS